MSNIGMKSVIGVFLITSILLGGCSVKKDIKNSSDIKSEITKENTKQEENEETTKDSPKKETENSEKTITKYVDDKVVNAFINDYNSISNSSLENIKKGNIKTKYFATSYGYYLELLHSNDTDKINITDNQETDFLGKSFSTGESVDFSKKKDSLHIESHEEKDSEKLFLEDKLREFFESGVEIKGNLHGNGKIEIKNGGKFMKLNYKKKFYFGLMALFLGGMAFSIISVAKTTNKSKISKSILADNAIVNVKSYGFVDLEGAKTSAIIVEYNQNIKADSVNKNDYEIIDYAIYSEKKDGFEKTIEIDKDRIKGNEGQITKVYVNNKPEISKNGGTKEGKYVIIEVNTDYMLTGQNLSYTSTMMAGVKQIGEITGKNEKIDAGTKEISNYTLSEEKQTR